MMPAAWSVIKEQGLSDVNLSDLTSLAVKDYSQQEIGEDSNFISWETAFEEVEKGMKVKEERFQKELDQSYQQELERQKNEMAESMKADLARHEEEKRLQEQKQAMETMRIEQEKKDMEFRMQMIEE